MGTSIVQTSENFKFDTLQVGPLNQNSFSSYTGRLVTAATGSYNDPVFGQINTRTLIKPVITAQIGIDGVVNTSTIDLRMIFDPISVWGDTTVPTQYSIYRVNNLWRGIPWQYDDQVLFDRVNPVASFQRSREDTVTVSMAADWVAEFGTFYNADEALKDSLFSLEFNGLVIVADDDATSNAISFLNIANTDFFITRDPNNPADEPVRFDIQDWAYTVERVNNPAPNERLIMNSTNDILFSTDFTTELAQFNQSNIVNAEIVFYEDTLTLQNNLPAQHVRMEARALETHVGFGLDPDFDITFGTGDSLALRTAEDATYRFNVTAYVNAFLFGELDETEFFFSIVERSGLLSSTLLFNSNATDPAMRPKLIITTIGE